MVKIKKNAPAGTLQRSHSKMISELIIKIAPAWNQKRLSLFNLINILSHLDNMLTKKTPHPKRGRALEKNILKGNLEIKK